MPDGTQSGVFPALFQWLILAENSVAAVEYMSTSYQSQGNCDG
jgi:hypothetical protein